MQNTESTQCHKLPQLQHLQVIITVPAISALILMFFFLVAVTLSSIISRNSMSKIFFFFVLSFKLCSTSAISKSCGNYYSFWLIEIHHLIPAYVCVCVRDAVLLQPEAGM